MLTSVTSSTLKCPSSRRQIWFGPAEIRAMARWLDLGEIQDSEPAGGKLVNLINNVPLREFVESGIGVELGDPLKSVYCGLILGNERFIRQTLDRLDKDLLEDEEITRRKALQPTVGQETILEAVAKYFGCDREYLVLRGNGKARNIAIYLLTHQCGMTSQEVSRAVGGMSCAAVAKVYQRLRKQLASDGGLKQEIEELKRRLSNVQV